MGTPAIKALTVGQPIWLAVYMVMLFVLGLAFAFVNVSGEQISERMRKSGEYIYGVYPGQETSAYINRLVLRLGFRMDKLNQHKDVLRNAD